MIRFERMHAIASAGSLGQLCATGRDRDQIAPAMSKPARTKMTVLYSLKRVICGKDEIAPASVAPNPSATSRAGMTQQTSVAELPKSAIPAQALLTVFPFQFLQLCSLLP